MTLSLDTAYRSFGGEVEASSTPTICRLSDSRRHQLWAIAQVERGDAGGVLDERNHCELFALHRLDLLPRLDALRPVRRINPLGDDALAIQLAGRLEQRLPVAFMVLTV